MKQLVLDAGPLIAFFYAKDTDHLRCKAGFEQLFEAKTILLTPIPVVFEIYKWLLQRTTSNVAQTTLEVIQKNLKFVQLNQIDFDEIYLMVEALPQWRGTLIDTKKRLISASKSCYLDAARLCDLNQFQICVLCQ